MEFSRQEYWTGLPFPIPGDLPHPGITPTSLMPPALVIGFFTTWTTVSRPICYKYQQTNTLHGQISLYKMSYAEIKYPKMARKLPKSTYKGGETLLDVKASNKTKVVSKLDNNNYK